MSHNSARHIGERNRHMEEGFGLVTARNNPINLREKEYYLTDKGRALLHSIMRQLKKGEEKSADA